MGREALDKSSLKYLEDDQTFIFGNSLCTQFIAVYKVGFRDAG